MPYLPLAGMLTDGLSGLQEVWTAVTASTFLGPLIGLGFAGIGVSIAVGIIFHR